MSIEWHRPEMSNSLPTPHGWQPGGRVFRERIEERLEALVPSQSEHPGELHRSIRYSLLSGGKRIRPVITMQVARDFGAPDGAALDPACAIEMIHTASLILDDLPCMDDASLRRGKPANHKIFGEETAILAATALLNQAFGVVADSAAVDGSVRLDLIRLLSNAVGSNGIIAGQFLDLHSDWRRRTDVHGLTSMYAQKTGALFVAAVETGARVARVSDAWIHAVRDYAVNLGLAFQILDDLLDTRSTAHEIGKDTGQDDQKATVVSRLGVERAQREVRRYVDSAARALAPLGDSGTPLMNLARSYTEPTMERVLYL